jgi:hypothetical protein
LLLSAYKREQNEKISKPENIREVDPFILAKEQVITPVFGEFQTFVLSTRSHIL